MPSFRSASTRCVRRPAFPTRAARAAFALAAVACAALPLIRGLALPAGASPPGATAREKAIAEIREFEERFNKAYEANDLKAYWGFYADEMTQFYPQGRLDLPDYQAYWEKHVAEGNRLTEVRIEDLVIHMGPSNDAAVAHYRIFVRSSHPDGSTAEEWAQESDVMFKRDGRWKIVHMHYSLAPEKK